METLARTCQILYDKRILDAIKQTRDLEKKLIPFTCPRIPFDTPENFNNQITILSQNALFKIRNLHISGDPLTEFQCEALKQIIFEEIEIFTRDLNTEWCKQKAEEILLCITCGYRVLLRYILRRGSSFADTAQAEQYYTSAVHELFMEHSIIADDAVLNKIILCSCLYCEKENNRFICMECKHENIPEKFTSITRIQNWWRVRLFMKRLASVHKSHLPSCNNKNVVPFLKDT